MATNGSSSEPLSITFPPDLCPFVRGLFRFLTLLRGTRERLHGEAIIELFLEATRELRRTVKGASCDARDAPGIGGGVDGGETDKDSKWSARLLEASSASRRRLALRGLIKLQLQLIL